MNDTHERFRTNAAAYLAEVLSADESAWMESHAAECASCAEMLARVHTRLPELRPDAEHPPVSALERWVHSPDELTPLERELMERHLGGCNVCRGDADEMARLAGIACVMPMPRRQVWLPRRSHTAGSLVAAAVLVAVLVRLQGTKTPPVATAPEPAVKSPPEARLVPPPTAVNEPRLRFPDQLRGGTTGIMVDTLRGNPTGLSVQLPVLFLPGADSAELRVLDKRGEVLLIRFVSQEEMAHDIRLELPHGHWQPGRYRLAVTPLATADNTTPRVFRFRLIDVQRE